MYVHGFFSFFVYVFFLNAFLKNDAPLLQCEAEVEHCSMQEIISCILLFVTNRLPYVCVGKKAGKLHISYRQ